MSKSQRRKGHDGERELCALLSEHLGTVVKRHLGQSREGGCDIRLGPFHIEAKRRVRIAGIYEWMDQADLSTISIQMVQPQDAVPVVAFRADGKGWLVTFRLPDAIRLMRESL